MDGSNEATRLSAQRLLNRAAKDVAGGCDDVLRRSRNRAIHRGRLSSRAKPDRARARVENRQCLRPFEVAQAAHETIVTELLDSISFAATSLSHSDCTFSEYRSMMSFVLVNHPL